MTQSASRPGTRSINKLALTMCTLLSSQGPDALPARPTKGFRQRGIRLVPPSDTSNHFDFFGGCCLSGTPSGLRIQGLHPVTVSAVPFSASAATSDYSTQAPGGPPTVLPPGRVALR